MAAKKSPLRSSRTKSERPDSGVYINVNGHGRASRFELRVDESLQASAMRWSYVLRNRKRWATRGAAADRQREMAEELVQRLGLKVSQLKEIADAGVVEISIPFQGEQVGWEQRIFPWEFAIAAATREHRGASASSDFAIVRQLRRPPERDRRQQSKFLYVQSVPTRDLSEAYDFGAERAMAERAARAAGLDFVDLRNPTLAQLRSAAGKHRPRIIHLAGFDTHQGLALIRGDSAAREPEDRHVKDGYLLTDAKEGHVAVESDQIAEALTFDGTTPDLVCCNLYYSAPRTAALCVARGAGAATGFQDTFDDTLGEVFHSTLYRAWMLAEYNVTSAFCYAWKQVRTQGKKITGTGIVLWSADSIVSEKPKTKRMGAAARIPTVAEVTEKWEQASLRQVTRSKARVELGVAVSHLTQLNYSILHNNRPLFTEFKISKTSDDIGLVAGIEVNVELHVGYDSYPCRWQCTIPATQRSIDISDRIRLSLASSLNRAVRESIHTSLFIDVTYERVTIFRETRRVTLLPIDEWQDSDENRKWLPSFVLPRDPAVRRIIDLSQRYLQSLADDPTAGFDGYQSVLEIDAKRRRYDCIGVDLQVRAIWSALLHDTPLSYINPPPTFTDSSQRLRSPLEIIEGGRGTCIDLALLVASCLEYVEIYPAIVLLTDHAFPCYWRAEEHFREFSLARSSSVDVPSVEDAATGSATSQQSDSWYYQKAHFHEVAGEIATGRLVPIEATGLCWRYSFTRACEEGAKNLSNRRRFDSMIDVRAAREDEDTPVTPLPALRTEV